MTDNGSYADGIVRETYARPLAPPARGFKPWHKPRKQYVRHYQWVAEIKEIINRNHDLKTLKYLGLPGEDLLDLRYLHDVLCHSQGIALSFLGLNEMYKPEAGPDTQANVSLDEVRRLPSVTPESDVVPDKFSSLSIQNSIASQKARQAGPFHVINLDLCNALGAEEPTDLKPTMYAALFQLFGLQAKQTSPWLLFITTRVGSSSKPVHPKTFGTLLDKYASNLYDCTEFRVLSSSAFNIEDKEQLEEAGKTELGKLLIFLMGLCMWTFRISSDMNPPQYTELRGVISYKITPNSNENDMFSIALRFEPTLSLKSDSMGLSGSSASLSQECEMAAGAVQPMIDQVDADVLLAQNDALYEEMVEQSANLLEQARYSRSEYFAWLPART